MVIKIEIKDNGKMILKDISYVSLSNDKLYFETEQQQTSCSFPISDVKFFSVLEK